MKHLDPSATWKCGKILNMCQINWKTKYSFLFQGHEYNIFLGLKLYENR